MSKRPFLKHRTRQGRPPKWLTFSYDECADEAFKIAGQVIRDAKSSWADLKLETKMDLLTKLLPLALKRIPDKHEVRSIAMSVDPTTIQRVIDIAERNMLIQQDLISQSNSTNIVQSNSESNRGDGMEGVGGELPPTHTAQKFQNYEIGQSNSIDTDGGAA